MQYPERTRKKVLWLPDWRVLNVVQLNICLSVQKSPFLVRGRWYKQATEQGSFSGALCLWLDPFQSEDSMLAPDT